MEERQDVVHPVSESAHELVLELGMFDLHWRALTKQNAYL
jgi:hypothetical protein